MTASPCARLWPSNRPACACAFEVRFRCGWDARKEASCAGSTGSSTARTPWRLALVGLGSRADLRGCSPDVQRVGLMNLVPSEAVASARRARPLRWRDVSRAARTRGRGCAVAPGPGARLEHRTRPTHLSRASSARTGRGRLIRACAGSAEVQRAAHAAGLADGILGLWHRVRSPRPGSRRLDPAAAARAAPSSVGALATKHDGHGLQQNHEIVPN